MIRVILVDDHAVVRTGYHRLLDAEPGIQVVGEAATADEANALVVRTEPDVALVDLSLKGRSDPRHAGQTTQVEGPGSLDARQRRSRHPGAA
jgi:DNA-binding NarL/FixJ family response regulator